MRGTHSSELQAPAGWGARRQYLKLDHHKSDRRGHERERCLQLQEPAEAEPKWQRETLAAATGRTAEELVESFQELLEDTKRQQQALLSHAVPSKQLIRRNVLHSPAHGQQNWLPRNLSPKDGSAPGCPPPQGQFCRWQSKSPEI